MKKLKVSVFVILLIIVVTAGVYAAPLKDVPKTLTQPDGSTVECLASGDEYFNFLHDDSGNIILKDPNTGYYVYAKLEENKFTSTGLIYGKDKYDENIVANRTDITKDIIQNYVSGKISIDKNRRLNVNTAEAGKKLTEGTINNITIFIRFIDEAEFVGSKSYYNNLFNGSGADIKSLYNYYKEVSYNKLNINTSFYPQSSGTIISYQDINPRAYYQWYNAITNPVGYTTEEESYIRECELIERAINSIKNQIPVTKDIDNNDDGNVDNLCLIVKGEPGEWGDLLWPHKFNLYYNDVYINNKKVDVFNLQLQSELEEKNSYVVLSHEMFHTLGAPDLYHYSLDEMYPAGYWDIMEYGESHMSAYMKYRYGQWLSDIPEISVSGTYELNPLTESSSNCYKIASPYSSSEYFVVEYRKYSSKLEEMLPGEGLLVYRVNTDCDGAGNAEGPPDEVYFFRPNGSLYENGLININEANLSAETGRTAIGTNTSIPMFLSNGSDAGITIYDVGSCGDTISFSVDNGVQASSVTLNKDTLTLAKGTSEKLIAQAQPAEQSLVWESSDASVATVTQNGTVAAKNPGRTTITVTTADGQNSDTCEVLVDMASFKPYQSQTTTNTEKSWTITLNKAVNSTGLKNQVYITDSKNEIIETTINTIESGAKIVISPISPYAVGESYTLWIKDVKGAAMESIKQWIKMDFTIALPQ